MKIDDRRLLMLLTAAAFLFFSASARFNVSAQQRRASPSDCPTVRTACPDSVGAGQKLTFVTNVSGGDQQVTPTYNWTVSAGTIESGQGTSTIEVDTGGVPGDSTVTATVDVGGFARECSTSSSCTTTVMKKAEARKFDEYGPLAPKDENARLDNFVNEIQMDPQAQAYVIAYGGRAGKAGDAQRAANKAKDYLVKKRGIDSSRVVVMDGGYREQAMTELWLVPSGANPPQPEPTVKPNKTKPATPAKKPPARNSKKP